MFEQSFKNIDDVLWKEAGCATELDTVWLSQRQMAEVFDTSIDNISLHLKNIYIDAELDETATTEESSVVRNAAAIVPMLNIDEQARYVEASWALRRPGVMKIRRRNASSESISSQRGVDRVQAE